MNIKHAIINQEENNLICPIVATIYRYFIYFLATQENFIDN